MRSAGVHPGYMQVGNSRSSSARLVQPQETVLSRPTRGGMYLGGALFLLVLLYVHIDDLDRVQ